MFVLFLSNPEVATLGRGATVVITVLWLQKPTPKGAAAGAAVPHEGPQSLITYWGWEILAVGLAEDRAESCT